MRGTVVVVVDSDDVGCDQTGPKIVTDWLTQSSHRVPACVMFAARSPLRKLHSSGWHQDWPALSWPRPAVGSFAKCGDSGLGTAGAA